MKIYVLLIVMMLLFNCASSSNGPNYNVGRSHNECNTNRMKVVYKQDKKMKNAMIRHRKKSKPRTNSVKKDNKRKFI